MSAAILLIAGRVRAAARGRSPDADRRSVSRRASSAAMPRSRPTSRQAAEKMPEADYNFKPGSTPEARTFGAAIAHIAQSQFGQCSGLKGVPNPMQGKNLEQELKTKAEVTKALADSFALCDDLFAQVTDANATEMVKAGQNEVTRAAALYGVIVHGNEMAGTAYVYLRSKNIVPPSTESAQARHARARSVCRVQTFRFRSRDWAGRVGGPPFF